MLKINYSLICHHLEEVPGQGINLIGVVEDYVSQDAPLSIDQMTVILGAELSGGTKAQVELKLLLNGQTLYRTDPSLNRFTVQGNSQVIQSKNIPVNFGSIVLPEFGQYTLQVLVDGKIVHRNSFRLLRQVNPASYKLN